MEGKISIIIPIWKPNIEFVSKCLQSVLEQTYQNLEIIIIYRNELDYDESFFKLLEQYSDKRIILIQGKSKGFVNALNEGLEKSTGEYIARIDSDDYCEQNRLELQLKYKKENDLNIVGSWAHWISDNGKIMGTIEMPTDHKNIRKKIMFHCPMLHPTILMDKNMLQDIGFYDPCFIHAEDYELYFRAMYKKYKLGNIPKCLVYIRDAIKSRSRGNEWKIQRAYYVKAKNKAVFNYGFTQPYDIFFHMLSPIAYFMSPNIWMKVKRIVGWKK